MANSKLFGIFTWVDEDGNTFELYPVTKDSEGNGVYPAIESADFPGCYYRTVGGVTEWISPPMMTNVEYRTTERTNGKVIYRKLITMSVGPSTTISLGDDVSSIVRIAGRQGTCALPRISDDREIQIWLQTEGASITGHAVTGYQGQSIEIDVCYVKKA